MDPGLFPFPLFGFGEEVSISKSCRSIKSTKQRGEREGERSSPSSSSLLLPTSNFLSPSSGCKPFDLALHIAKPWIIHWFVALQQVGVIHHYMMILNRKERHEVNSFSLLLSLLLLLLLLSFSFPFLDFLLSFSCSSSMIGVIRDHSTGHQYPVRSSV